MRVALGAATAEALVSGDGAWTLEDAWGRVHARARDGATWVVERRNRRLRARSSGGRSTAWSDEPFMLRPAGDAAAATWNGRAYRGTVAFVATDTAIVVINHVGVEDYLRGVVPIEIGAREPNEAAAVEAQAIAARSYVTVRMRESSDRAWDLTAAAIDQAYGGRAVEHTASDAAIAATKGLVLTFDGRVVRAPYHSTCGGRTAASDEIWQDAAAASARGAHARGANARGGSVPSYLRGVSDRIPGSDRAWCERSPRLHWSRTITGSALTDMVARYARLPGSDLAGGSVRGVRVERETATGRVAVLAIDTDGGTVRMRGNAIRFALREIGGEILNSTYFSLEPVTGRDGRLAQVTLRGTGNGHGVGMCQWGAIGRARAGQSAREILTAYYPGTVVDRLSDSFTEPRTAPR